MKQSIFNQANRRYHSGRKGCGNGNHTALRVLAVALLCGFLGAGSAAWAQTRSTSSSSSRTENVSDARTEKRAVEKRSGESRKESVKRESDKREESIRSEATNRESARKQEEARKQEAVSNQDVDARKESNRQREDGQRNANRQSREMQQQQGVDGRNRDIRYRDTHEPSSREPGVRDGGLSDSRIVPTTRLSIGYRVVPGNHRPERNKIQLPDIRFRHDYERCSFCFGVGFLFSHDGLHRIRCSHCYGRGFALDYSTRLDDMCPICYGPVSGYGHSPRRTMREISRYVTDRLSLLLDLSPSQERQINRIVMDYLRESRYDDWFDQVVVRDRKILRELTYRQRDRYLDYINNLDSRDLCDRCFDYF